MFKWLKNAFSNKGEKENKEVEDKIEEAIDGEENSKIISEDKEEILEEIDSVPGEENLEDLGEVNEKEVIDEEENSKIVSEDKEEILEEIDSAPSEENLEDLGEVNEKEVIDEEENSKIVSEDKEEIVEEINSVPGEENLEGLEDNNDEDPIDLSEENDLDEVENKEGKKLGFFAKLKKGLEKTRDNFTNQIDNILKSYKKIDEELFEDLEEILITSDVGMETTMDIIDNLRDRVKDEKVTEPDDVMNLLKDEIKKIMLEVDVDNELKVEPSPAVILVVGVNGVGKTTTIGKMANRFKKDGKKVLVAAGDTFRAAAIEQLEEWGNRANVDIISHSEGADPAAVIYDGIQAAKARNIDVLICDTAGRLHNKSNLMNELNKIFRVVENEYSEATKEILLVLDATTGQNALSQAKVFKEVANITGIALTKLDGTAKGGVVIALQSGMEIPIKLIGVGEGIDDLQPFDTNDFVDAMFDK